jgi:hypothetical protein
MKRIDNAPLDELRIYLRPQLIQLAPLVNQISALPIDKDLEYYFIPAQYMVEYAPYYRPGKPFKNLKLVNYGRSAISLSFNSKHKYVIKRDPNPDDVLLHLKTRRDELLGRILLEQLSNKQQQELRDVDEWLRRWRDNPESYQACFSNYHHYYRYWYCTYRFFDDETQLTTSTVNEHMLKHTERIPGQIHERLNIIFVDTQHITRPVPNDNKLIDRELDTYPTQFKQGVTTLYLRRKE